MFRIIVFTLTLRTIHFTLFTKTKKKSFLSIDKLK